MNSEKEYLVNKIKNNDFIVEDFREEDGSVLILIDGKHRVFFGDNRGQECLTYVDISD